MESIGCRSDSISSLGVVSNDGSNFDEFSAKFSVQGTSSSKSTGKKKVVSKTKNKNIRNKFQLLKEEF